MVALEANQIALRSRFAETDTALVGPWFAGGQFGLVDAAFGPVFRYLDAFEGLAYVQLATGLYKVAGRRAALAERPSVTGAVGPNYADRLTAILRGRGSFLTSLLR